MALNCECPTPPWSHPYNGNLLSHEKRLRNIKECTILLYAFFRFYESSLSWGSFNFRNILRNIKFDTTKIQYIHVSKSNLSCISYIKLYLYLLYFFKIRNLFLKASPPPSTFTSEWFKKKDLLKNSSKKEESVNISCGRKNIENLQKIQNSLTFYYFWQCS